MSDGRNRIVNGDGPLNARIFFVGEAPGAQEDATGKPFVGRAGKFLESILAVSGIRRENVFITNIARCRPPGNRRPTDAEIRSCLPYLADELKRVRPKIVVALGAVAIKALIGRTVKLADIVGRAEDVEFMGIRMKVVPCYHPSAAMRSRKMRMIFESTIEKAASLSVK